MSPDYIVLDDRAAALTDEAIDRALVLYAFDAKSDAAAIKEARRSLPCGFVLFRCSKDQHAPAEYIHTEEG